MAPVSRLLRFADRKLFPPHEGLRMDALVALDFRDDIQRPAARRKDDLVSFKRAARTMADRLRAMIGRGRASKGSVWGWQERPLWIFSLNFSALPSARLSPTRKKSCKNQRRFEIRWALILNAMSAAVMKCSEMPRRSRRSFIGGALFSDVNSPQLAR
jgi:hypothetical protein